MKNHRIPSGISAVAAFLVAAAGFAATGQAFQKSPFDRFDTPHAQPQIIGYEGFGSGPLALPTLQQDGELYGLLVDDRGVASFHLEALLTGCIPVGDDKTFWFGRMYGVIHKPGENVPELDGRAVTHLVEGVWHVNKYGHGSFQAKVVPAVPGRGLSVIGYLRGKFEVRGPTLPLIGNDFGSAAATPPKSPYKGVAWKRPNPYRDAASAPHKDKPTKSRLGDAASKDRTPPFGDAGSQPIPRREGQFGVYFRFQ